MRMRWMVGVWVCALSSAVWGATVTQWTFEPSNLSTGFSLINSATLTPAISASTGIGQMTGVHASTNTNYTEVAGNGGGQAISATNWAVADYWQFSSATTGFNNIMVGFDVTGSSTGPLDFTLAYSTDGTNFTNFGTYAVSASFASKNFDLSGVLGLNNAAAAVFRLVDSSTTSIGGGTVGTAGTSRVDNFTISGTALATGTPLPGAAEAAIPMMALVLGWRRRA